MWKWTTAGGAINFAHVRRIHIKGGGSNYAFKGKSYKYIVCADDTDIEYFGDEEYAQAYVENLISELNNNDND